VSPDAVDLVVEHPQVDEIESRESRRGPSVRQSALKKVYGSEPARQGEDEAQKEATVATRGELNSRVEEVTRDGSKSYNDSEWTTNVGGPIRLTSSQVRTYRYDDIPDDHNPWA
jgi:hypothetical protein